MPNGRVIIVTGAASGIGLACAHALAGPEVSFVLTARSNRSGLDGAKRDLQSKGAHVETKLLDLTEAGAGAELVTFAREKFGPVDQIVSNAGEAQKSSFKTTSTAHLDHAIALNTRPFLELTTTAYDDLANSRNGRVVAISSFVARTFGASGTMFPATAASKAALEALAKSLAFELAPTGTTVNCIAPGFTAKDPGRGALDTKTWDRAAALTPNGKLARPADIGAAVAFLLSEGAQHITGQTLNVDGGLSLTVS